MKTLRQLGLIILWTALGLALGAVLAFVMPAQYVSTAELAVDAEALSSSGLARFDRLSITDGVEVETLVQLVKSSRVSHAVAGQLSLASFHEIEDHLKVLNDVSSAVVKLKATAGTPAQAQAIARGIVAQAVEIDGAKRRQRTIEAIDAVKGQLAEIEQQLGGLNGQIQKLNAERGIALSNEPERQQRAATELAQYAQRMAALHIEAASLQDRAQRLDELLAALPAGRALPAGFAIQEADKSPGLAEARQRLLDQESALASLQTRYGRQHPKVQAAEAEVAATRQALRGLLLTQREIVRAQVADNASGRKIIGEKIAATETDARQSDLSLDPAHANLLAQRDAVATIYGLLATRLTELRVFAAAHPATFYVFSEPTFPDRPSRLRPAAALAAGTLLGAVLGFWHCLLRWRKISPVESGVARPAYVAP